jgi:hypothetical protein
MELVLEDGGDIEVNELYEWVSDKIKRKKLRKERAAKCKEG